MTTFCCDASNRFVDDDDQDPWNSTEDDDHEMSDEDSSEDQYDYWHPGYLGSWVQPLSQFKQYHGLTLKLYNRKGLKSSPEFEDYASRIQTYLRGPLIGPQKGPNFRDQGPYVEAVGGW